nr:M14 family zinc carboxypeptidase [uncultured Blautia sp.]
MEKEADTYEKIYYSLWELAERYRDFMEFRVIGNSHDERMIPMLEMGKGKGVLFCLGPLDGRDQITPKILVCMAEEYAQAYECGWLLENFYDIRKLLDQIRLCIIPLANPDGYEICQKGFSVIRNPIYRQMLRMQEIPWEEYWCNARGTDLSGNFPTAGYKRTRTGQEPASENEVKALIRIFQEYQGEGLLSFGQAWQRILYYTGNINNRQIQKSHKIARNLQKCTDRRGKKVEYTCGSQMCYHLEKQSSTMPENGKSRYFAPGAVEPFYQQITGRPALRIEIGKIAGESLAKEELAKCSKDICLLPLEYIFTYTSGLVS